MDEHAAETLLALAEDRAPRLRGLDAKAAFDELERVRDDVLPAVDWFVASGRVDDAFRLASALPPLWTATKRIDEGLEVFERVLSAEGGDDVRRGRAAHDAGLLAFWQGDDERGTALLDRSLELGRATGDPTVTALALAGIARVALREGDLERAASLCREALHITEGTDDRAGRSGALHVLGVASQMSGDLDEARALMSERVAIMRELGNQAGISNEGSNLAMVERQLGNLDTAEALGREAVEIDFARGDELGLPWKLNGLAAVAAARGAYERGAKILGAADAMMESQGTAWPPDELVHHDETIVTLRAAMGDAYDDVYEGGRAMTTPDVVALALG